MIEALAEDPPSLDRDETTELTSLEIDALADEADELSELRADVNEAEAALDEEDASGPLVRVVWVSTPVAWVRPDA